MHQLLRVHPLQLAGVTAALALFALPPRPAHADDLIGLYIGAGIGESRLEATLPDYGGGFIQTHFSYQLMAGVRPISFLGAELQYLDLGGPSSNEAPYSPVTLKMHGAAAYGVLYLPVPVVDVYLKAGAARLQSTVGNGFDPFGPGTFSFDRTNLSGTGGLGAQYKFGAMAVRADYELFNAAGGHQNLWTAGITWTFL